jgi:hypothetical protein
MEQNMKAIGLMISKTELVLNLGLMELSIKANIWMGRKKDKENSCGQMAQFIKVNSSRIIFMVLEHTAGLMEECLWEIG